MAINAPKVRSTIKSTSGQSPVEREEDTDPDDRRQHPTHELNQPGANEVTNTFRIGHDARDEDSDLVRIKVRDR
jgi:hypothetical protein